MSRKRFYRSDLFSAEQLTSRDALESAVEELQSILRKYNPKCVLQELVDNEISRTLALVLSTLGQTTLLISWLLESFPTEATNYEATIHYKVISCLSTELNSSDFVEDKELCARYHKVADITPKVLQYLVSFLRPIDTGSEHYNRKGKAKQPQKKPQEAKREGATTLVKKYFDVLNVNMPETSSEATALVDYVLQGQKETLKFYLELLCRPGVSLSLKEHCVTSASPIEDGKNAPAVEPFACPIIHLMKSALYFDTAEGFGQWTVIVSSDADNFLRSTHKKDISTFNVTVKKIKELSCGHFTDNNQKRLSGSATEVPIFEAKVSRNLRLVYQIDIIPGDDNEQQAIKIFGIYTHDQMDHRLWSSISSQLRKKGKEYRKRCTVRKRADQTSTFIPAFFPPLPGVLPPEIEDLPNLRPDETVQIHSRLVVEKYVTFSQPFLNTILADVDATFPYMVSTQEKRIIEHPKSCYVIGRSGTGKTTTMLFKMLLIERTFQLMALDLPRPRQVFVTKSKILAKKVQEYFEKLASSLVMASQSPTSYTNPPTAPNHQAVLGLIDADDIVDWRTDLPAKYSDLEQRHFPLFITFDGLCDMLETDIRTQTLATTSPIDVKRHIGAITYDYFCECYWSHFPEYLIKGLDPALVFSEIIGIIEGSAETLSDNKPYLSEAAYLDLSSRRQSIPVDQRCKVYHLFELYLHKKKLQGEYDTGDRTHKILKHFAEQSIPGKGLDHIYVDEVQDNTLIDTMVLRALCSNADGLFWAGDTAQTISVGSSFRFNALKAFQWKIEDLYRRRHSLSSQQPPKMFQLSVNYRSHAGIVNCAHSIIDLITIFWKDSIDRLSPEMGIVDGAKPIFFNNEDRAQLEQFVFCDGDKPIELGAQQCIIVKNEMAKEKLRQKVGEVGVVLTVYESKGLEFNDVLLYNFFADSSADLAQWRVVLNAIEENKQDLKNPPPRFDHIRHASICNELKSLYVAITRARENVWIADGSETGEPMRIFWTNKGLIDNHTWGSDAPRLASSSTPEEWAAEGRELFNAKRFFQAKHCYFKAGLHLLASIADAYDLRAKARNVIGTSTQKVVERRSCFTEAANSFFECAKVTKASAQSKDSTTYLRISGECFEQADKKYQAAKIFYHIRDYTHAAELYKDIGELKSLDEAVAIVKSHKDKMVLKVVQDVIKLARLAYFSNGQITKGHKLFDSVEEEVKYLKEKDFDDALAHLLESVGRVCEAAELHCSRGRRLQAIALFLHEADNKTALHRAQECIMEEFWCRLSFGLHPDIVRSNPVKRLMRFASRLDATSMENTKAAELSMFKAIMENQGSQLRALGLKFHRMHYSAAALLCLDQYFTRAFRFQDLVLVDAVEELGLFHTYVRLLSTAAFRTDPSREVTIAALFGFRRNTANEFIVPQNTWLHSEILKLRNTPSDSDLKLSVLELCELFRRVLQIHIKQRIIAENEECARSKAFRPCLRFAVSGHCMQSDCPKAHVSCSKIDSIYYNMRVHLHFQQIVILQSLRDNAHKEEEVRKISEFWLHRLSDALHPPDCIFGSISHLALSTIPEASKALDVVGDWVQTLVYGQEHLPQTYFVPEVMQTATLAHMYDRSQAGHLRDTPYFSTTRSPPAYIRQRDSFVHNLLSSMSGDQTWSLTAGCLFVERVVRERLPINIVVLCDFLDLLCSSVILQVCQCGVRLGMPLLHSVIVPYSWLLRFASCNSMPYFNEGIHCTLLEPMRDLLQQLCTGRGCEHLLLYGTSRNISNVPYQVRHVFISRIFNAVGLLDYNLRDEFLCSNIQKLRLSLHQIPVLYSRYIDATSRSWDELAEIIRHSLQYEAEDEMIQLVHQSETPEQHHPLSGVRQLLYRDLTDIRAQLGLSVSISTPAASPRIEVPEQKETDVDASEVKEVGSTQEADAVRKTASDDAEAIPAPDMTTPGRMEREIAATLLFQRLFRKVLRHRRGEAKRGITGLHAEIYASCIKEVSRLGDNPRLYLRLFLGPLPHILVCLEMVRMDTYNHRTKTEDKMQQPCNSDELNTLGDLLTRINTARQTAITLQEQLNPSSAFHERRDIKQLRKLVEEAGVLVSSLPFEASSDLSNDLHLAIKGIVAEYHPQVNARSQPSMTVTMT
ncbi:hypothetical protein EDD18DRAFT_32642 [Armillaria luteobubalina]|uniref:UvrD-like helicase ATP-binding domain-containing protein n=1 Tax=Armillaria luteobubalina TaxID=153913 RepID=A0AA39QNY7_9AGAR|nr:hypothetical protein EDD18DRAFT_32642 [Armillaria luteobubalina]